MEPETLAYDGDVEAWQEWQVPQAPLLPPPPPPPTHTTFPPVYSPPTSGEDAQAPSERTVAEPPETQPYLTEAMPEPEAAEAEEASMAPTVAYDCGVAPTLAYDDQLDAAFLEPPCTQPLDAPLAAVLAEVEHAARSAATLAYPETFAAPPGPTQAYAALGPTQAYGAETFVAEEEVAMPPPPASPVRSTPTPAPPEAPAPQPASRVPRPPQSSSSTAAHAASSTARPQSSRLEPPSPKAPPVALYPGGTQPGASRQATPPASSGIERPRVAAPPKATPASSSSSSAGAAAGGAAPKATRAASSSSGGAGVTASPKAPAQVDRALPSETPGPTVARKGTKRAASSGLGAAASSSAGPASAASRGGRKPAAAEGPLAATASSSGAAALGPDGGFAVGQRVLIDGLASMRQLNGTQVTLRYFDSDAERWVVELDGGVEKRVRPVNLKRVGAATKLRRAATAVLQAGPGNFQPGQQVIFTGLVSNKHLNGMLGVLSRWDTTEPPRWVVTLPDGVEKRVRMVNLKPSEATPANATPGNFRPGQHVVITGLASMRHLNGSPAVLQRWDSAEPPRWVVSLPDLTEKRVRAINLKPAEAPAAAASAAVDTTPPHSRSPRRRATRLIGKQPPPETTQAPTASPAVTPARASGASRPSASPRGSREAPASAARGSAAASAKAPAQAAAAAPAQPSMVGTKVRVKGDGWGAGRGNYFARVTEADELTFTVVFENEKGNWEETAVLREHCTAVREGVPMGKRRA